MKIDIFPIKFNNPLSADVIGDGIKPRVKCNETLGLVITTIKALEESDRNTQLDRFYRPLHGLKAELFFYYGIYFQRP
jgi:hypothetical protein